MPKCATCGAELEPPVRILNTVYVKTLYRIGGWNHCRHHIINAELAAGLITEVKPGAGHSVPVPRGANLTEREEGFLRQAGGCHHH